MFRDVQLITNDYSLRIQLGYAIFRWWRPLTRKDITEGCRCHFGLSNRALGLIKKIGRLNLLWREICTICFVHFQIYRIRRRAFQSTSTASNCMSTTDRQSMLASRSSSDSTGSSCPQTSTLRRLNLPSLLTFSFYFSKTRCSRHDMFRENL